MGSHSGICHPTEVTPAGQVGTRFMDPVWMKGWVGLVGNIPRWFTRPQTVTHPGTNRIWRSDRGQRVTTKPNCQPGFYPPDLSGLPSVRIFWSTFGACAHGPRPYRWGLTSVKPVLEPYHILKHPGAYIRWDWQSHRNGAEILTDGSHSW